MLRSELEDLDVDRLVLRSVLDTFGRHRLLSFDRDPITRSPTVEISHEALLTEWTRLRDWIDGARHDVRVQRRLAEAMREWIAADRADAVPPARRPASNRCTAGSPPPRCSCPPPNESFLDASVAERDREADELLDREQRAVVAERRQRQRGRQLVVVGLVAVLVAALGVFGTVQWRSAVDAKRDVDDLLDGQSLSSPPRGPQLDEDPELALLLAMQSVRQTVDLGLRHRGGSRRGALRAPGARGPVRRRCSETPVAARPGPKGPVGVYALPPNELMELAESAVERTLTDARMPGVPLRRVPGGGRCPDDLQLRGGLDCLARPPPARDALAGTTVTIWLCST